MSLAARLSLFFLVALGAVLVGFSLTLYLLGRSYLWRQLDEHIEKALDTLEAAVDVETGGLEWEPQDRRLTLGVDPGIEHVRWAVQDRRGRILDLSANAGGAFPPRIGSGVLREQAGDATAKAEIPGWRLGRRHLRLPELLSMGKGHAEDDEPEDDIEYPDLILTVGLSPGPMEASLNRLTAALVVVSTALWLLCAALGGRLSRRALDPVTSMAASARAMAARDGSGMLPSAGTGDELEDLGRAFNELLARRHEAIERQGRFAGDASHQLRTPLAGLIGLIDVIRRRPRTPVEYEETLDRVRKEANRLGQIVESLLFLARSEAEAIAPHGEIIDLAAWVPVQLRRWSDHPRVRDLRCEGCEGVVPIRVNAPLLAQALENLMDNALKYSEPGTPVTVSCGREASHSFLAVSDRGCGLEDDEVAAVFEPFYRSPGARRLGRSGIGLGLSVVQRIVAASCGTITVESSPGVGTRFVLRFPEPETAASASGGRVGDRSGVCGDGNVADVPSVAST